MAMDEAKRAFGLSFDEWKYKADKMYTRIAELPEVKKELSYAYSSAAIAEINTESMLEVFREVERNTPPPDGYTYILPSPNEGKRLLIHGWIYPGTAAEMVSKIWEGKATVDDFPEMTEIDLW